MIYLDVTEPSISPYSSPAALVPKKDGSVRFCIDFRKVKKVTEFDAEPMPNMEEVIIKMSGHKFFTKMDLSKGYWQFKSVCRKDLNHGQHLKHQEACSNLRPCPSVW